MMLWLCAFALAARRPAEAAPSQPVDPAPAVSAPTGPDRSRPPPVAPPSLMTLPEPERHPLAPGVEAWLVRVPGVRHVEVQLQVRAGQAQRPGSPAQWQAMGATANLATSTRDQAELAEFEALHALDVYVDASDTSGCVGFDAPREEARAGWELLTDVLHASQPGARDIQRYAVDVRRWLTVEAPASAAAVADSALRYAWFPADHPAGLRPDLASYGSVTARAVRDGYRDWLASAPLRLLIVGDVAWADVEADALRAVQGLGREGAAAQPIPYAAPAKTRVIAVDMPGQEQVALRLRMAAPAASSPDRVAYGVTNWALGGHSLSRLNTNLREDKGYTYGAGSDYAVDAASGYTTVGVDVPGDHAVDAIREIEHEITRLVDRGVTEAELSMAYQTLGAAWNGTLQTAATATDRYITVAADDDPIDAQRARYAALATLSPEATAAAARAWLAADQPRVWVVVGDRHTLEPQLDALGWTTDWIAPDAAVLGRF